VITNIITLIVAAGVVAAVLIFANPGDIVGVSLYELSAYLAAAVRRNLPLGQALRAYSDEVPGFHPLKRRDVLSRIAELVDSGSTFSAALDTQADVFPPHFRAIIRAGERGGNLGLVLGRLAEATEVESAQARRTVGYAMYPLSVAGIAVIQFMVMGSVVAPQFMRMLQDLGVEDPTARSGLELMYQLPVFGLALFIVIVAMVAVALPFETVRGPTGHLFRFMTPIASWLRWRVPLLSRYERRKAVSRFALAAEGLLTAGVPTVEALEIAADASGNRHFDQIALAAMSSVSEGMPFSKAFRSADVRGELPADFFWYLEVGENSSRLPDALARAAESSALRGRSALGTLVRLLFPATIILMGIFVGTLGYAFFHALLTIMKGLGV
jgi:type IV pilus assembly protein PilC